MSSNSAVVIPLYREDLSALELRLVKNNLAVLSSHAIIFLLPDGLNTNWLEANLAISRYKTVWVSQEWLGEKNGIAGYNRMMLSASFYRLFEEWEYILICQSDVYIFRDELSHWCNQGYDCIAAPWVKRPIYSLPILKQYMTLRRAILSRPMSHIKQDLYGKIGNGGLSLRRVSSFIAACERYRTKIEYFLAREGHLYHEDVFWALVPEDFSYPSQEEAMHFSIDTNPKYCMKKLRGKLPFGCHGLTRSRLHKFWSKIVPEI
ncbi:MAG: DUF5672 family protein [Rikenellaceae bacterium]